MREPVGAGAWCDWVSNWAARSWYTASTSGGGPGGLAGAAPRGSDGGPAGAVRAGAAVSAGTGGGAGIHCAARSSQIISLRGAPRGRLVMPAASASFSFASFSRLRLAVLSSGVSVRGISGTRILEFAFTSPSHTDRRNSRMAAELGCNAFKLERLALKPTPQRGPRQLFVQVRPNKRPAAWDRQIFLTFVHRIPKWWDRCGHWQISGRRIWNQRFSVDR